MLWSSHFIWHWCSYGGCRIYLVRKINSNMFIHCTIIYIIICNKYRSITISIFIFWSWSWKVCCIFICPIPTLGYHVCNSDRYMFMWHINTSTYWYNCSCKQFVSGRVGISINIHILYTCSKHWFCLYRLIIYFNLSSF